MIMLPVFVTTTTASELPDFVSSNDASQILSVEKSELKSVIQLPCTHRAGVGVRCLVLVVNVQVRDEGRSSVMGCVACVLVNMALCGPKYVFSQQNDDTLAGPHSSSQLYL